MSTCYVILAHVTWALAHEWALFTRAAKTVTWALTWEWVLVRDSTVTVILFLSQCDYVMSVCVHKIGPLVSFTSCPVLFSCTAQSVSHPAYMQLVRQFNNKSRS